jgi:hypothetical protein
MQFNVVATDGVERSYSGDYWVDEKTGVLYIQEQYTEEYGGAPDPPSIIVVLAANHGGL